MTGEKKTVVSFDEFKTLLSEVLLIGEDKLVREASFVNDLSVDSIRWVEMAVRIEQMGVAIPTEAFWEIQTVGDAYDFYQKYQDAE